MAKPMTTKDKIREWISDNLRYMLLIGAILLIVAAVLLIVHLVSPKNDGKSSGGTVTSSSTGNNVPDKKTQVKADSKADSEDSTGISSDVSDSANDSSADASSTDTASAPDAEAEPTSEPEAADDTSNTENTDNTAVSFATDNVPEVSTVLEQYYTALGARDINGLFAVTDNLTAEEQAQIEAESDVESYGDVKVYTISGPSDGTYIAFVSSRCKYLGINQTLPMLSEYYLYTTEDGGLKIMDDTDSDAAVTEAMKAALENEEVKNLIEQVQNDYRNALDADASLRVYVESIQ
ncbi:hypothetical protein G5B04_00200 [Fusicatenibacter saccharivorans]|jgi:hypothetical protein|uniref:hypothetical protein n=1 Tax=Lachnospiraceae TaxID=186803 RepID=UPI000E41E98E|nr:MULTISPECIES: hypothetical protein [Lachnospiraceae]NSF04273.1 hypothetical protein [Fusicatenibacter saccharivorans]RGE94820.1 hypothetical protein DW642_02190 [Blautia sp. AM23-13AC]RGF69451.1 hypothetical protein DWZ44_00285 [Blautia sp. AF32-4BH]RHR52492.1 hypothetical protein DWX00_03960 [Blautia sp. AF17-9LB]RHU38279.1 hypothetical protein DXD21_05340 [Blautia sp. TF12-12AT]